MRSNIITEVIFEQIVLFILRLNIAKLYVTGENNELEFWVPGSIEFSKQPL